MICPHCKTSIHESFSELSRNSISDIDAHWYISSMICPECGKAIIRFRKIPKDGGGSSNIVVYPKNIARSPISKEIPSEYTHEYLEAANVLQDSPKASAALSRRCLQHILREKAKLKVLHSETGKIETINVKAGSLDSEIQQVLDNGGLPSSISQGIDAIRVVGNFAAHPIKSKNTGGIVDVEEGEAEWNLDVIESLFDYYFVQPAILEAKRKKLNAKLEEAGKPQLK